MRKLYCQVQQWVKEEKEGVIHQLEEKEGTKEKKKLLELIWEDMRQRGGETFD